MDTLGKNLIYVPADIPPMPDLDISMLQAEDYGDWCMFKMTYHTTNDEDKYKIHDWLPDFREGNPKFMDWLQYIPSAGYVLVKIHRQDKGDVGKHVDFLRPTRDLRHYHHLYWHEPCGYRVVWNGKRKNTTYVIGPDGKKIYVDLPDEGTNTYIMNYTTCIHGVEQDPGRDIVFFQMNIDTHKHKKLVKKSLEKYGDYSLWFDMDRIWR